jgi:fibronectin type 3 domain-containing protein
MHPPELNRSFIAVKLSSSLLLVFMAAGFTLGLCGCAEYSQIPLAGQQSTNDTTTAVKVTLQWNRVPGAASYNVYWSRFPGVTRHNSYKITNAANPITITDLEPDTTYYFVVTVIGDSGEGKESKEMSFAAMGATGTIDFKDLFDQAPPTASTVKPEKSQSGTAAPVATPPKEQPEKPASTAARDTGPYSGQAQATLAWDDVPDAISYNIYWRTSPGVTKQNGTKIENVKNPHTLKNLAPGKTYYLVVTAVGKDGESNISQEIAYTAK